MSTPLPKLPTALSIDGFLIVRKPDGTWRITPVDDANSTVHQTSTYTFSNDLLAQEKIVEWIHAVEGNSAAPVGMPVLITFQDAQHHCSVCQGTTQATPQIVFSSPVASPGPPPEDDNLPKHVLIEEYPGGTWRKAIVVERVPTADDNDSYLVRWPSQHKTFYVKVDKTRKA